MTNPKQARRSPSFFSRDPDQSVRVRLRFEPQLASLIEEAAGRTPLLSWIYSALEAKALEEVEERTRLRKQIPPPAEAAQRSQDT